MNNEIFNINDELRKKLGLSSKYRKSNFEQRILDIFAEAKNKYGKDVLTIDEITAGYYTLFTSKEPGATVATKTIINSRLHIYYKQGSRHKILSRVDCGKYKLYKKGDVEYIQERKSRTASHKHKKVMYKGKEYASMSALATELNLDISTISRHYKRHNGDLSTLGSYSLKPNKNEV